MSPLKAGKKGGSGWLFSFSCNCRDLKSVSITSSTSYTSEKSPEIVRPKTAQPPSPSCDSQTSFSDLLLELKDMEQCVRAWESGCSLRSNKEKRAVECVAIVKESVDPLGDFRMSMLQMIVEEEIVGRSQLLQLLRRFLSLNSPTHHDLIILAFAEICSEVFSGIAFLPFC